MESRWVKVVVVSAQVQCLVESPPVVLVVVSKYMTMKSGKLRCFQGLQLLKLPTWSLNYHLSAFEGKIKDHYFTICCAKFLLEIAREKRRPRKAFQKAFCL